MISLEDMIQKRYPAPGWMCMFEVANGTGYKVNRHADAVALGIWPSHGYELHGIEIKRSRGDVQKELADPSKADAIGQYVDFWWMVVSDLKIIDGLALPPTWGILYPRSQVLRVHRKAPKRTAKPIDRAFAAAMIRNALETWTPKHVVDELRATAHEQAKKEIERVQGYKRDADARDLKSLQDAIKRFEEHTGVCITQRYGVGEHEEVSAVNSWQLDRIGKAVKIVMDARDVAGAHRSPDADDTVGIIEQELGRVELGLRTLEQLAGNRRAVVGQLREMLERHKADVGSTMSDGEAKVRA